MKRFKVKLTAQSTIEFTFAMVVSMFLIFGMVMLFRWAGMDLANRRLAQDRSLTTTAAIVNNSVPLTQLSPDSIDALPIDAIYHGKITTVNASE